MKARKVNEDFMDDLIGGDAAVKTIAGWDKMYRKISNKEYTIKLNKPSIITTNNDTDYNQLIFLLQKYRVPFEQSEAVKEGKLRFSDGVEFETSGKLRAEKRFDGWYVVGEGKLIPVDSEEEGNELIKKISSKNSPE